MKDDKWDKKILLCSSVARSGSHPVYSWIEKQFTYSDKNTFIKGVRYFNVIDEKRKLDIVFQNYGENKDVKYFFKNIKTSFGTKNKTTKIPYFKERERIYVFVLRDPFNLFASRSYHVYSKKMTIEQTMNIKEVWKGHAKEILGDTNYYKNKIPIIYNKWFTDIDYRKKISGKLGGMFSDESINVMHSAGGYSSFDRKNKLLKNSAQKLRTLERWKKFLISDNYDEFKKKVLPVFKDEELISLSHRIFGHITGTETLYNKG